MGNIAINKPATASTYVMPYAAANAVNGVITPLSRWLCNTLPGWLKVDLGAFYLVNQWVIKHMPVAGWAANYANSDFKLQGSNDNTNWFDIDSVTGNTASTTSRTINPTSARYFRTYFTKGLNANTQLASVMEFELYQAYSAQLTNLAISAGTLTPIFSSGTTTYTASINISNINVTPTAFSPTAVIKVNNVVVTSGQPSLVNLTFGSNTIIVNVTDGAVIQNYTITVTRAGSANLNTLIVKDNSSVIVPLSPTFDKTNLAYNAKTDIDATSVTFTPTVEDPQASVKVNGTTVASGQTSGQIAIVSGLSVPVEVTATTGNKQTYTVAVSKHTSAYLTNFQVKKGSQSQPFNPNFTRNNLGTYNLTIVTSTSVTIWITKEDPNATVVVTSNGTPLTLSGSSYPLSMATTGIYAIVVTVTSTSGDIKTYTLNITRN